MYNIMVVEDSKPILREIIRLIENEGADVKIESTYDGNIAMELMEEFEPDILFTDIKMPMMDGLTLISKAKALFPKLKTVIISGYDDFSLTHQAILLHVDEYMMKPVDEAVFHQVFLALLSRIDHLKKEKTENRIYQLIQGSRYVPAGEMPERYVLTLIRAGLFQQYAPPVSRERICAVMESRESSGGYFVAYTKLNSEKMIVYNSDCFTEEQIRAMNAHILEDLQTAYMRVNMLCSQGYTDIKQLSEQYAELSNRLGRAVMLDSSRLWQGNENQIQREAYLKIKEEIDVFRRKMERIRKNKSGKDFCREIEKRVQEWQERKYPVYILRKFLLVIFEEVFQAAELAQNDLDEPGTLADKILSSCPSYEQLRNSLLEYSEFMNSTWNEKNGNSIESARQLTEYMQKNLYKNISLQDLADKFRISPSYICRVYKIHYGETPISFFNHMKIEEGRRLLEEYEDMKVKDIAELLGFSDQYYFSKVFKQQFGVSPQVYRQEGQ